MESFDEIRQNASELRQKQKYAEALPLFKKLWEEENNKWDGWGYALCLRKLKKYEQSIEISENILKKYNNFTI